MGFTEGLRKRVATPTQPIPTYNTDSDEKEKYAQSFVQSSANVDYTTQDYVIAGVFTLLAFFTRFWAISDSNIVVW